MMNATKEQLERFARDVLKRFDGTAYEGEIEDIYHHAVHGDHFTAETLETALDCMENDDGTEGGHWTVEQTTSVARNSGITFDHFNEWDWCYAMNMIWSDYHKALGDSVDGYVRMAKAFMFDRDAPEGKAYRYWKAMRG